MTRRHLRSAPALLLAGLLAGCAAVDQVVQKGTAWAVKEGQISEKQAASLQKTSAAFRKSAEDISESEEYYIGRAVAANILSRYKPLEDPALNRYVQTVAQAVSFSSDRPVVFKGYHVQLLDTEEVNAFAAPGGFLFVTRGMLERLETEDQLACVLAHELAHVSLKHGLKAIKASRLTEAFKILGTEAAKASGSEEVARLTEAFEGAIEDVVGRLVVSGYSRDKEFEADHHGALFAQRANYHPGGLARFISRLKDVSGGIFRTHPGPEDRLVELGKHVVQPSADFRMSPLRRKRFAAAVSALR